MRNYYVPGEWNVVCQRCGFKHKSGQLQREWTGLMVCEPCFEVRHPQTLIKVPEDDPSIPWASPEGTDIFVSRLEYLTVETAETGTNPNDWIKMEDGSGGLTTEN